jgi:DNA invertase Pin-like site-specific DNA recombinase
VRRSVWPLSSADGSWWTVRGRRGREWRESHEKRPGLRAAISRIEDGEADALAVARLDRLSRRVRDLADLAERSRPKGKRKGWGLILLDIDADTSRPSGEFMVNVMGSAAQWGRRIISQRTKDALAVSARRAFASDGRARSAPSSSSGSCGTARVAHR